MSLTDKMTNALDVVAGTKDINAIKAVIEVQKEIALVHEENRRLREENHDLKNIDIVKSELTYKGNAYYHNQDGPYCTTCFDVRGILVRLTLKSDGWTSTFKGICGNCKNTVITDIEDSDPIKMEELF